MDQEWDGEKVQPLAKALVLLLNMIKEELEQARKNQGLDLE